MSELLLLIASTLVVSFLIVHLFTAYCVSEKSGTKGEDE